VHREGKNHHHQQAIAEPESLTHSINKHRIGAACARDLLANGASLALTYSTNKTSLSELVTDLNATKGDRQISTHQCDVAKEGDLQRLFDEVKESHGKHPDIVVANAGYGKRVSNILELEIDEWDYTINVNLRSSFIITKLAVPHMQEQGWGRVIYISSIAAGGTSINGCHYSASKGASKSLKYHFHQALTGSRSWRPGHVEELGSKDGQEWHHFQRCRSGYDHRNWDDSNRRTAEGYSRRREEHPGGQEWKHGGVCERRHHALSNWVYDGAESFVVRRAQVED